MCPPLRYVYNITCSKYLCARTEQVTVYGGNFQAHSQNFMNRLSTLSCLAISLSVHMRRLVSHWTDIHEIWCSKIFFENLSTESLIKL